MQEDIDEEYKLEDESSYLKRSEVELEKLEIWNDELNSIYGVLKEQLNSDEFEELKISEINWWNWAKDKSQKLAENFEGMDYAQVEYNMSLAKLTKDKCYELVNKYLK